jgi:uncharacterized protein YbjT (DUF2867 family)
MMQQYFITGGTGYMGTRLTRRLIKKGCRVTLLIRKGSEHKVPAGAEIITGDPFDATTFQSAIPAAAIFIQLLGVPHPSPRKARLFKDIDLRSVKASADAAAFAGVSHFIYVSVAQSPSKLMHAYQEVRKEGEDYCQYKNLPCTFIRPWYVLGPGHWWPLLLLPVYGIAELIPSWKMKMRSMALVTISQMLNTLEYAGTSEPKRLRILEIKDIRNRP